MAVKECLEAVCTVRIQVVNPGAFGVDESVVFSFKDVQQHFLDIFGSVYTSLITPVCRRSALLQ